MLVSLIGRSFLSDVERPSILRTGLPVAPSLSNPLATHLSAHAPAQRAGAQRLRAMEVADILREHGPAWREANRGHASLDQLKVMSAIERCRTAALGGHVARCENAACGHTLIAYNSCRNRHCPKCQAAASRRWLADREAE